MEQETNEAMQMFQGSTEDLQDMLDEFYELHRQVKTLEELKSRKHKLGLALADAMQQKNLQSLRRDDGALFYLNTQRSYKVPPDKREDQRVWCRDNEFEASLSVNYNTWNGMMRERAEAGEPIPEFTEFHEEKVLAVKGGPR